MPRLHVSDKETETVGGEVLGGVCRARPPRRHLPLSALITWETVCSPRPGAPPALSTAACPVGGVNCWVFVVDRAPLPLLPIGEHDRLVSTPYHSLCNCPDEQHTGPHLFEVRSALRPRRTRRRLRRATGRTLDPTRSADDRNRCPPRIRTAFVYRPAERCTDVGPVVHEAGALNPDVMPISLTDSLRSHSSHTRRTWGADCHFLCHGPSRTHWSTLQYDNGPNKGLGKGECSAKYIETRYCFISDFKNLSAFVLSHHKGAASVENCMCHGAIPNRYQESGGETQ